MTSATTENPALHHVTLKTVKLDEMVDWYGKTIGMKPNYKFPGGAWMTNDEANHRFALLVAPGLKDDDDKLHHTGMHHTAFEYSSIAGLLGTYERLAKDDILPHGCLDHGVTTSFYYLDPDGNSLELQADNFGGDWAQSSNFMRTAPEFDANPIGVPVDPAKLLAAFKEGADADELHRRGYVENEFAPAGELDLNLPA